MAVSVQHTALRDFVKKLFIRNGVNSVNAGIVADNLVDANLYGVDSHGVIRSGIYLKKIQIGAMNRTPAVKYLTERMAFKVIDGDNAPGAVVAHHAVHEAINLARAYSVGICGAINSNHFGDAGLYTRMVTDQGMIGIAFSNVAPLMGIPGVENRIVGNNPISFGIPRKDNFPIVLDMALSNVAQGKIIVAEREGRKIPPDWSLDEQGEVTTDPAAALKGSLYPIAGFKGLGLAIIVDILCGVLSGGGYLDNLNGLYTGTEKPGNISHFFMAVNPGIVDDDTGFPERLNEFCTMLLKKDSKEKPGTLKLPGQPEYETYCRRVKEGVPLAEQVYDDLRKLGKANGVEL